MNCLRCGYCCTKLLSVVVDDPALGICKDNYTTNVMTRCKHLLGDKVGEYSCAIHHYDWFTETPCAAYQAHVFFEGQDCRLGSFLVDKQGERQEGTI